MKKKRVMAAAIVIVAILGMFAAAIKLYGPNFGIYLAPPSVKEYAKIALDRMASGLYARGEDWKAARSSVLEKAETAKSYAELHTALDEAAKVAGGKHSAVRVRASSEALAEAQQMPKCELLDGVLYIKLPPYDMQSGRAKEYVSTVVSAIKANMNGCKGVIVDLRDNTGGDMGPMATALSPLLPDGTLMSFDIRGQRTAVELKNGTVSGGGSTQTAEAFKAPQMKIAVLQNELTASSAEAVLLCFKGLENASSFGSETAGYCSVNTVYNLYDGAFIQLTIGSYVDRLGSVYPEAPIAPDRASEKPLEDALAWINE